ncbi:hypothetical protein Dda_3572 [Drechslerella dactyloides]|uniref:Uncharacterized protein n=1 Tax=Drechslerella dactyloides TaxID=74499 RepID=A0AAD6J2I2_DREDA|nr:hypothetical protein Dda_3572 [Drechslerella dactyloides]
MWDGQRRPRRSMAAAAALEAAVPDHASTPVEEPQDQPYASPEHEQSTHDTTINPQSIPPAPGIEATIPLPLETGLRTAHEKTTAVTSTYDDGESFDEEMVVKYPALYGLFKPVASTYAEAMEVDIKPADTPITFLPPTGTNATPSVDDYEDEDDDDEMPAENHVSGDEYKLDTDGDTDMTDGQRMALGIHVFAASSTPLPTTDLRVATTRSAARALAAKTLPPSPRTPVNIAAETGLFRNARAPNTGNTTEHRSLGWYDSTSFSPLESSGERAELAAAKAAAKAPAKGRGRKKQQVDEESDEEVPERILPSSSDDGRPRRATKGKTYKEDSESDGSDFNDSENSDGEQEKPKRRGRPARKPKKQETPSESEEEEEEGVDSPPKKRGRKPKNADVAQENETPAAPKTRKAANKKTGDTVFKPDASSEGDEESEEEKVQRGKKTEDAKEENSDGSEEQDQDSRDATNEDDEENQGAAGEISGSNSSSDGTPAYDSDSSTSDENGKDATPDSDDEVAVRGAPVKTSGRTDKQSNIPQEIDPSSRSAQRSLMKRINVEHQRELHRAKSPGEPSGLRKAQAEKAFELQEEYKRDGSLREVKMTGFMPAVASWFGGRKKTPPAAPPPPMTPPPPPVDTNSEGDQESESTNQDAHSNGEGGQSDNHEGQSSSEHENTDESNGSSTDEKDSDEEDEGSDKTFEITAREIREVEKEMEEAVEKLMQKMDEAEHLERQLSDRTVEVEQLKSRLEKETQRAAEMEQELEARTTLGYDRLSYLYRYKPQLTLSDLPGTEDESRMTPLDVQTFDRVPFSTKLVANPFRHEDMYHRREIVNKLSFPGNIMLADPETDYFFRCCNCHAMSEVRLLFFQDEIVWSACICFTCFDHHCCEDCARYTAPMDSARLPRTSAAIDKLKEGEASGNYETRLYTRGIWSDYLRQKENVETMNRMLTEEEVALGGMGPFASEYEKAAEKAKEVGLRAAGKGKRKRGAVKEEGEESNPKSKRRMIAAKREQLAATRRQERRPPTNKSV